MREPEPRAHGHDMSEAVAAQSDSGRDGAQSVLMVIVVMADGELLPGYVPPDVLAKHLKDGPGR